MNEVSQAINPNLMKQQSQVQITHRLPQEPHKDKVKFINPLALSGAYDPEHHARFQVDLPKEDYHFFRCIDPSKGVMQTIVNHLLLKLQTELKQHGITDISRQSDFKQFIVECRITGRQDVPNGISATRPVPETSTRNVGGRKKKTLSKN